MVYNDQRRIQNPVKHLRGSFLQKQIMIFKANTVKFKVGYYVDLKTRSIRHVIFELHLHYSFLVWAQNFSLVQRLH